ncbi:hypothetical protein CHS0354_041737 [Potamilus streckersoni]|uniref:Uncharacterized protein n=1 Tax=Potamilus streckersoni TaxID=2493646 RepID=A0AAE0T114_9BIVA|nr:hypothetical protein CHS0354_041737 [Potamilus streckersoni]
MQNKTGKIHATDFREGKQLHRDTKTSQTGTKESETESGTDDSDTGKRESDTTSGTEESGITSGTGGTVEELHPQ